MSVQRILPEALCTLRSSGSPVALLDVRDPVEADSGHIPGMTNVPRNRVEFRIADLVPDLATTIVLYCDGDSGRSLSAARALTGMGYSDIRVLDGGLQAWKAGGGAVATGNNVPSKHFGEVVYKELDVPRLGPLALDEMIRQGKDVAILDIRTPSEHAEACIPGAVSLPSFDIAWHALDLARNHDLIVLHCAGRTRSIIATQTMRELGMENVVSLENGTIGWILAGLTLARGQAEYEAAPVASAGSIAHAERRAREIADAWGVRRITAGGLKQLLAQEGRNRYVFDIRPVDQYRHGHIPGSTALPGGQAVQRTDDFIALRGCPVVLAGEGEAPANLTAAWLRRMGCADVSVLEGGLASWVAAGGALEPGRSASFPPGWDMVRRAARMVSPQQLQELLSGSQKVHLLDVDHSASFRKGHVAGATWLPRAWLEQRVGEVVPGRDGTVVLLSADGAQACYAAATLAQLGYEDVSVLAGGTRAWAAAGLPVESGGIGPQDDELLPPYKRGTQAMHDYISWETQLID